MKVEFLYENDTYKTVIEGLKNSLKLEENEIIYTPVVQAGLNIFSFQKKGETEETAKQLDTIKNSVLDSLSAENLFIITDEISSYFCQRLYPQLANFERGLRKVIYIASVKSDDGDMIKFCKKIEELEFSSIYQMIFSDKNYVVEAKKIVNSSSPAYSKYDMIKRLSDISESTIWDKLFKDRYSYISKNFLDIKNGRNKVMHSRNISYTEFSRIKNMLSKSNNLFKDIEIDLLEKEHYGYSNVIHTITDVLNQMGKAMSNLAMNTLMTSFVENFGEFVAEKSEKEEQMEEMNKIASDFNTQLENGKNEISKEIEELCLIN